MLISIIVPVLNSADTLEQCIRSVTSQTYADKELIVLDGGSTDGSIARIEAYADSITFWQSEPDHGVYDAFNKGIRRARGEWLYFFGADDFLSSPNVLDNVAGHLRSAGPQTRIAYGQVALLGDQDQVMRLLGESWHTAREKLAAFMPISHQGVFHRRSLFERNGVFDTSFRFAGDYELLLREVGTQEPLFIPETIIAMHRSGGLSGSPRNESRVLWELRRAQKSHGIDFPRPAWIIRLFAAWVHRALRLLLGQKAGTAITDGLRRFAGKKSHWSRIR